MPILFAVTLFVSALLLFMIQPMIGRMILPLLGGSPAAWNTCMVFFQFTLLLGYLYAHKLTARLPLKTQVALHLCVLGVAVLAFAAAAMLGPKGSPIHIASSLVPQDSSYPMFGVMALLAVAIGIPFFAVSASAPLLTRWFSKTTHPAARDPYFLYATSNAGSLLSLLIYPIVTEPSLTLKEQSWLFASGFAVLVAMVFACGHTALSFLRPPETVAATVADTASPTTGGILKWIALAFVPSSLMLGVTFYMTTDIASIPLLWVIPLALYLLTFIIAFLRLPSWFRVVLGNVAPVVTLLLIYIIITQESFENPLFLIVIHLLTFFLLSLMCHSELAFDRPPPQYLTNFFLWISVGGMLGGVFNALIAPVFFGLAYEYPIALCLGCVLVPRLSDTVLTLDQKGRARLWDILVPMLMLLVVAWLTAWADSSVLTAICEFITTTCNDVLAFVGAKLLIDLDRVRNGVIWALPLIACFFFIDRPVRFGLCVSAVVLVGEFRRANYETHTERSFFGIMKVRDDPPPPDPALIRTLVHGTTIHGKQALDPWPLRDALKAPLGALLGPWAVDAYDWRAEPLTYYHRTGPVGHMFAITRQRHANANVGMVGLGTGSVACYADKDLSMRFFEIDPTVKALVADRKRDRAWAERQRKNVDKNGQPLFDPRRDPFFTYVIDAEERGANVEIILGDARLKLDERKNDRYDLLLVDAFSSDAIPVHLLTKEALQLYMDRLTPDGLLGLHISNKFVKLDLVVAKLAHELGLTALEFNDSWVERTRGKQSPEDQYAPSGKTGSSWVVLAKDPKALEEFRNPRYTTQYRYIDQYLVPGPEGKEVPKVPDVNAWKPMKAHPKMKLWTDDFSDVMMVMMLPQVQKARGWFGLTTLTDLAAPVP